MAQFAKFAGESDSSAGSNLVFGMAIVAGILVARHLKTTDDLFDGPWDDKAYAFGLPKEVVPQPPKRPDPKTLRPDFIMKVSQPVAVGASID